MSAVAPLSHVLLQSLTKVDYPDRIAGLAFNKQFCVRRDIAERRSDDGGIRSARVTINRFNSTTVFAYSVKRASSDASSSCIITDVNRNRSDTVDTAEEAVERMVRDLAYLYDDSEVNIA